MSILSFKIRKFKSDFPRGKQAKIFLDGKVVSAPQKLSDLFKKISSKKMFSALKTCKVLNKKTVLILNMVLKVLYGFYL